MRTWKILDRGDVPLRARLIRYSCLKCHTEAHLPVIGVPIAQIGQGLVFDVGPHAVPRRIECRSCRHEFEIEEGVARVR